jgi:hypothetical protein
MDIYVYRAELVTEVDPPNVTGWDVESVDGEHIGKVDEATYESGSGCLVVDTGFWIFGKKRLIPAGVVTAFDPDAESIYVTMTKDEVKSAPDYDADRHRADESSYHDAERGYYGQFGSDRSDSAPKSR